MSPPERNPAIPHELLLGQAGFLRRLARDLVRDSHAAEDAVQDAWVAALEHPPRHEGNVRAWLGTILKNLVAKRAHTRERRTRHELEAGRERVDISAAAPVESETTLRFVTEAVLALDEPYRAAILLRYFEDLSPSEIAERQSVPVATVKSRLRRALELLRLRMERERREDGRSMLSAVVALAFPKSALTLAPHAAPLAKAGTGVLVMSLQTKIAAGCAALLVAALVYREFNGSPGVASEPLASETPSASVQSLDAQQPAEPPLELDRSNTSANERTNAPAPAAAKASQLFFGKLLDPEGEPIQGARMASVTITDATGRRRTCNAQSDGAFAFSSLPAGRYWTFAWAEGFRQVEDVIDLDAGHGQVQRDFTLRPATVLKIRATTPDGRALSDALGKEPYSKARYSLQCVATKQSPGEWIHGARSSTGGGRFQNSGPQVDALGQGYLGLLALDEDPPAFVSLLNSERVLQTKGVAAGDVEVDFVVSPDDVLATAATIRLQVIDAESHAPLPGAHVRIAVVGSMLMSPTDEQGNVLLEAGEPAEYTLSISAADHTDLSLRFLAQAGATTDLGQIALDKAVTLELSIVDPDGKPHGGNFVLGVIDPATQTLEMQARHSYGAGAAGELKLLGLGRQVYILRTSENDGWNESGELAGKLASGNVLLDLRSGVAPSGRVIRLVPATPLTLSVPKGPQKGLGFRVIDGQGLSAAEGSFFSEAPYPLALPAGAYRVLLLDADRKTLTEQPLTVGGSPITLELAR